MKETERIARILTGNYGWHGMAYEILGESGNRLKIQREVNKLMPKLGWLVSEQRHDDNQSTYRLYHKSHVTYDW